MRFLSCFALAGGIFLISQSAMGQASGDDADEAGARFLLNQGLELVEQEDWSRAADRFRTALRMNPSPRIRYHLARSLLELGQLNEAEEMVVAIRAADEVPDDVRTGTEELAERIPAAGGSLTIRVDGPRDVQVFLDDRPLPASRLGTPMTASIGTHLIEARRDHDVLAREDVSVSRDTPSEITLEVVIDAHFALGGVGSSQPEDDEEGSSLFGDWRFWAIVGGGVVAIAVIIAVVAVATSSTNVEDPIVGNFQPGVLSWQ
jgi:hypothetical protein